MPSRIELATRRYRAALDADDAAAQARLVSTYQAGKRRLEGRVRVLAPLLKQDPTPARIFRNERYQELLAQLDAELGTLGGQLTTETIARQRTLVNAVGPMARNLVEAQQPGLAASFTTLPTRATEELVGSLADGSPLAETVGKRFGEARKEAEDALAAGIIEGQGPAALARTLVSVTDALMVRHVMTLARTAPMQALRTASLQTYRENADILDGWTWLATLSSRTCLACLNKHGTEYPLSQEFFGTHPNCRCTPIPNVKGQRLPLQSGQDWFDQQPAFSQRRQMGPKAWEAYKAGEVTFAAFLGERQSDAWGPSIYERSLVEMLGGRRPA